MKKFYNLFIIPFFSILLFSSCEIDEDANSFLVNGQRFRINYGIIEDTYITDLDAYYRIYNIQLQSYQEDFPEHYVRFKLFSYDTKFLSEGTYTYYYEGPYRAGDFSYCEIGYNMDYDQYGVPVEGRIISDTPETQGTMTITKTSTKTKFVFDFTMHKNGEIYSISGEFDGYLNEGITGVPEYLKK